MNEPPKNFVPSASTSKPGSVYFGMLDWRQYILFLVPKVGLWERKQCGEALLRGEGKAGSAGETSSPCRAMELPRKSAFPKPHFGNEGMNKALKLFLLFAGCVSCLAADVTLPLRTEAGKMATLLIRCGVPAAQARDIAIHKMANVKWWDSEFLPRFAVEQRSQLSAQLERYLDISSKSSDNVLRAEFAELVIVELLLRERGLSSSELFDPWQAGLLNQTEDWWTSQTATLSPAKLKQLNDLRQDLLKRSRQTTSSTESAAPPPPLKSPLQFSTRTEAAIALWNKSSLVPASDAFRIAMQTFENSATAFQKAAFAVDPDAVCNTTTDDANLSETLKNYKQTALDMLAAIQAYQRQMQDELRRTRLPVEQQSEITQKHAESYRLFNAWGSAAIQAADAGITLRSLIVRRLPYEAPKQHFIDTWNASYAVQQTFVERAQKQQSYTDGLLRK